MSTEQNDYAAAKSLSLDDIPVIDLTPLLAGESINEVAEKLMLAASNTGFFYIKNHGVEQSVIDGAMVASKAFFKLAADEKETVLVNQQQRGWLAPGMAKFTGAKTYDLKEIFFYGPDAWSTALEAQRGSIPMIADNQWPECCPTLEAGIMAYYNAVCELGHQVLSAIAIGMEEEVDFFASRYTSPLGRGQLVYYPKSEYSDEKEQRFGAAAHTDFGVLTLLHQDDNGGLQVLNKAEEWVEAPPIPGTFVCNIGDLLNRWTNHRLASNLHRVINRSGNERFSMPIFFDPDPDAVIDAKDFNVLADQERLYPAIQVSDYIDGKNRRTFSQYQAED